MSSTYTKIFCAPLKTWVFARIPTRRSLSCWAGYKLLCVLYICCSSPCAHAIMQIDRLNLEGYANLDHWVAELDKSIEKILLQRLTQVIHVWCQEFDRTDDGDTRRDALPLRDITNKRRGDKRMKEEKV